MGASRFLDPDRALFKRRIPLVALVVVLAALGGAFVAQAGAVRSSAPPAVGASGPALGPHQVPCPPNVACCPNHNNSCIDPMTGTSVLPASPYLLETSAGSETISKHVIHVGEKFKITFHARSLYADHWSFPNIAKKTSRCETGVDLTCSYVARAKDVTFPALATYYGWADYAFSVDILVPGGTGPSDYGSGSDYYAIIGKGIPVTGRVLDKHGKPVNYMLAIKFEQPRHGHLQVIFTSPKGVHGSAAHPYDSSYFGALLKPGTYTVDTGAAMCKPNKIHVTHAVKLKLACI